MRLLLALVFVACSAHAEEWTRTDKVLLGAAGTLLLIDWGQTRDLTRQYTDVFPTPACANPQTRNHPLSGDCTPTRGRTYKEKNPILGEEPSIGEVDKYFAASLLFTAGVAHVLPSPYRRYFLSGMIVWQSYNVLRNHHIGLRVDF